MYRQSIPIGIPVQLTQNVVYALPARACVILAEPNCEGGQSITGPWTTLESGKFIAASFIRCTISMSTVTCKV